jgi:DNA-binding MarR family transcriptional regulator
VSTPSEQPQTPPAQVGTAFLLTQLGTYAATRFAERVAELDLTPPQVGMLRMINAQPGLSQQALASHLGLLPSKVVSFVDELEGRELVTRTRSERDRRVYELTLTEQGKALMSDIGKLAAEHDAEISAELDDNQRSQLAELLGRLAEHHNITPGVHPGYRKI